MKEHALNPYTSRLRESRLLSSDLVVRLVHKLLDQIKYGKLTLVDAGSMRIFGGDSGPSCRVHVHDRSFYSKMMRGGAVGAAEAYMDGDWSTENLTDVICIFLKNRPVLEELQGNMSCFNKLGLKLFHYAKRDSLEGSRRNIADHYDLGNDFFQLFLDPTMMYSSGIFSTSSDSMEQASTNKMSIICEKLALTPDDHLLEIGTGWGSLAIYAAEHYGCQVTTTTISNEQYEHAKKRVKMEGLSEKVTVLKSDYRELTGVYKKLVSIEMMEAVGLDNIPLYLQKCASLLSPDGVMLLQCITIVDERYQASSQSVDFIQRYIFPGGALPSVTLLMEEAKRSTELRCYGLEDITGHYAETLHRWRDAFIASLPQVREMGFDDQFVRMWDYYLAYCEGGFLERAINCIQLQFRKSESKRVL